MPLKGVLFDLEGVLVDNKPLQVFAVTRGFEKAGVKLAADLDYAFSLRALPEFHQKMDFLRCVLALNKLNKNASPEELLKEISSFGEEDQKIVSAINAEYMRVRRQPEVALKFVTPLGDLNAFSGFLKGKGLKIGVVTNANKILSQAVLKEFDFQHDLLVTEEDCGAEKPDPKPYTYAAEHLGLNVKDCVVVEDTIAGLRAGKAAGCTVIGVLTGSAKESELLPEADFIARDLLGVKKLIAEKLS